MDTNVLAAETPEPTPGRGEQRALFLLALCSMAYPPVLLLGQQGVQAVFNSFAADSYYYLAVAHFSIEKPFYTFDGLFPTNGFHPLWQYYLGSAFNLLAPLHNQEHQLVFAFGSSVLFAALGIAWFSVALLRLTGNVALALLGTLPGCYYLLFNPVLAHSPWSFINGMETPLTLLWFGLAVYLLIERRALAHPSPRMVAGVSLVLTLLTLSRLDDIFLFGPFLLYLLFAPASWRERLVRLSIAGLIPLLLIGAYLLYNLAYAGMLLPVSGQVKSGIAVWPNLRFLIDVLVPRQQFPPYEPGAWASSALRVVPLYVPVLVAGGWIGSQARRGHLLRRGAFFAPQGYTDAIITLLAGYVLLKGCYNIVFVQLFHQGPWYFPASILTTNLILAVALARWLPLPRLGNTLRLGIVTMLLLLPVMNSFTSNQQATPYGQQVALLWERRETIRDNLQAVYDGTGIVSIDNGILAYALDMPTLSGKRFTLDKAAFEAGVTGDMFHLAYQRDFRVITSYYYFQLTEAEAQQPAELDQVFARYVGEDPRPWDFAVIYRDPVTGIAFIEAQPAEDR